MFQFITNIFRKKPALPVVKSDSGISVNTYSYRGIQMPIDATFAEKVGYIPPNQPLDENNDETDLALMVALAAINSESGSANATVDENGTLNFKGDDGESGGAGASGDFSDDSSSFSDSSSCDSSSDNSSCDSSSSDS